MYDSFFAVMEAKDAAIRAAFNVHVERVQKLLNLPTRYGNPATRSHYNEQGDLVFGWTMEYWGDNLKTLLIGTMLRDGNDRLLTIVDRSGDVPVVYEQRF